MICAEVEELRDLYVLGALSAPEADGVEEHLQSCRACTERVAQSWQAAQLLRQAVVQRSPEDRARAGLLDAIAHEQEQDELEQKIKVLPLRPRRDFHIPWRSVRWAAAAAVGPLLVSGWLAAQVVALQGQVAATERAREQSFQTAQHAADVLGKAVEHGGRMVALVGTEMAPTASGTLYYTPDDRDAVLTVSGLPKLNKGEVYQLWLLAGPDSMNGGTFYCEPDGTGMLVVKAPMPLTSVQGFRITNEPHGGNTAPAGNRYLWGNMERRPV
jgi:anti-sigma factor RsiW